MKPSIKNIETLFEATLDTSQVSGYTHNFYRYPARFSPIFAEAAINLFTNPGDIVYDPFMGGGTTLVEAMRLGRRGIGTDLNSLSEFISRTKTTLLTKGDIKKVLEWVEQSQVELILNKISNRPEDWIYNGYQRNISGKQTWPIRKMVEIALENLKSLANKRQENFIRCLLLNTAQWAVDCRKKPTSASEFRNQLITHAKIMIDGIVSLKDERINPKGKKPICLNISAAEIDKKYPFCEPPKLILTSPPYPGVHVLYHRWQIKGRKETPAPYWIANCLDGNGASFYTFGDRKQKNLENYFENMEKCYKTFSSISNRGTLLVQLVAFSSPKNQLHQFLDVLQKCDFEEIFLNNLNSDEDGRFWRNVPSRKFYANHKGHTPSSKEVLLVHRRS